MSATESGAGERCSKSWCAYQMPHEHTAATASAPTVEEAARLYQEALDGYEDALASRDPDRRLTAETRLRACARVLSQAQSNRALAREGVVATWDDLLSDPTQQLDREGVVIASIPATPDADDASEPCEGCERERAKGRSLVNVVTGHMSGCTAPAVSTDASGALSEAERQALIDVIADGRAADSIAQHGPAKDHALLHRVLRAECARFVEHAAPEVERIVAARESAAATRARAEEREAWSAWLDSWSGSVGPEPPTVEAVARALREGPRPFGTARGDA